MRQIDADALQYRRKDYGGYDDVSDKERTEGIMFLLKEDIDNAPTIDPVKHGKWRKKRVVKCDGIIEEFQQAQCSACGCFHTTPYEYYFEDYKYCPRCGAKMERSEE